MLVGVGELKGTKITSSSLLINCHHHPPASSTHPRPRPPRLAGSSSTPVPTLPPASPAPPRLAPGARGRAAARHSAGHSATWACAGCSHFCGVPGRRVCVSAHERLPPVHLPLLLVAPVSRPLRLPRDAGWFVVVGPSVAAPF